MQSGFLNTARHNQDSLSLDLVKMTVRKIEETTDEDVGSDRKKLSSSPFSNQARSYKFGSTTKLGQAMSKDFSPYPSYHKTTESNWPAYVCSTSNDTAALQTAVP